jgi:ATP-dependent RNA helicase SUPV3L1/SUV3
LRFVPDSVDGVDARTLIAAASRVLRTEIAARIRHLAADGDESFTLAADGELRWHGEVVGRMTAGERLLTPKTEPLAGEFVEGEAREKVRRRLQQFLRTEIERRLAPLFAARALPLAGVGRGLVFQLIDALGCLPAIEVRRQVAGLSLLERKALSGLGVRFGAESIYVEPLFRADAVRFRALLWAVHHGRPIPPLPSARRLGKPIELDPDVPPSFYPVIGLRVLADIALRPDRLERFAVAARRLARGGPFAATAELAAIADVKAGALRRLLTALGYRAVITAGEETFVARPRRQRPVDKSSQRLGLGSREGHPFAKLRELKLA